MKMPRYEIFQGEDEQWVWRLVGANNETICVSEGYTRRWSAKRGAKKARALSRFALIRFVK